MKRNRTFGMPFGEIIFTLYILGYLIISILPMVKYSVSYVVSGLYSLVFFVYYYFKTENKNKYLLTLIVLVLLGIIQGTIAYLNENASVSDIVNEPIRILRTFVPCFIVYLLLKCSKNIRIFIWIFITALFLYISIMTLTNLVADDMIARKLASGDNDETLMQYRLLNVGGFEFTYAFGLMLPLFFMLIFNSKSIIFKIFFALFVIYIFYYIVSTQYMILFVLAILSVILWIIFGRSSPYMKIIGILFIIILLLVASPLLRWIADFDIGELLRKRLLNLANFFEGKISIDDTTSRISLYKNAFITLLTNPLGQYRSEAAYESHSLILSTSASVGIIGLVFLVIEFIIYYKRSKETILKNMLNLTPFKIAFICYVVLAFFNPIGYCYEIAISVFLYVPLTLSLFPTKNSKFSLAYKNNYMVSIR